MVVEGEETIKDIKGLVRSNLKISGLSLAQKERFCDRAKKDFNDSYAAYLTYLLKHDEDYEKLLSINSQLKLLFDLVDAHEKELNKLLKKRKGDDKNGSEGFEG